MSEVFIDYKGERLEVGDELFKKRPFSPSAAKSFRKSPKHFVQYITKPFEINKGMLMGRMIETLAGLSKKTFDQEFMIYEKATGKGSRTENDKVKAEAMEKKLLLVTTEEYEKAKKAVQSLYDHDVSRKLIEARVNQQMKLLWQDKKTKIPCIGFPDFESKIWDEQFIVDLKVANDGEPDKFSRDAYNMDYIVQPGAYLDGYEKTKYQHPYFIFLVVEYEEPYNVAVNFLDNKTLNQARDEWAGTLKALRYCIDNKQFDMGYDFRLFGGMEYFSFRLPGYHKPKFANFSTEEDKK